MRLAGVSPVTCDSEPNTLPIFNLSSTPPRFAPSSIDIKDMPSLDTVTLVNEYQAPWRGATPSLGMLPSALRGYRRVRAGAPWSCIHGPSDITHRTWSPSVEYTGIIEELALGACDYILHLLLETPFRVEVDVDSRLRKRF